jgi:DNA-binding response OmpR family regulator
VPRSAVAIALPQAELVAVAEQLAEAGYEPIEVRTAEDLEVLLSHRNDIGVAILDGENDFDRTLEMYALLHDDDRNIPALMVVAARALDRMSLAGKARVNDEYFTRPYSAESLRWRVEAMLIRAEIPVDVTSSGIIDSETEVDQPSDDTDRGQIVIVFNPKGGVGKTTIANLSRISSSTATSRNWTAARIAGTSGVTGTTILSARSKMTWLSGP